MKRLWISVSLLTFAAAVWAGEYESEHKVASGKELKVNLIQGGDINVTGWDKDLVRITARSRGGELDDRDVKVRESGRGIEISLNPRYHSRGVELTVSVPNQFDLDLETMGGDVSATDIEGEINGKTMGGDLSFSGIKGELRFTTMGGDVTIRNSELTGKVKTMGGDLDFKNVSGDINSSTMGGDITIRNSAKDASSELDLSTMGGDIEVAEARQGLRASTMGGDIDATQVGKFLKVKTMGGDIDVREIDGWVDATTMGGDVQINVTGDGSQDDRDVNISSMGGTIDVTLPANTSAEFEIELTYTRDSHQKYRIDSDFPLQITEDEEWDDSNGQDRKTIHGKGQSGDGKNDVTIATINGNITIHKR